MSESVLRGNNSHVRDGTQVPEPKQVALSGAAYEDVSSTSCAHSGALVGAATSDTTYSASGAATIPEAICDGATGGASDTTQASTSGAASSAKAAGTRASSRRKLSASASGAS